MPELPEVETTIRYLRPAVLDKVIVDITTSNKGETTFNLPIGELQQTLIGTRISNIDRIGKWMLFTFRSEAENPKSKFAVGHLRMSGRYKIDTEKLDHPHNRFQIHFADRTVANYIDQRRFGTFHLVDSFDTYPGLARLGPDILSPDLNPKKLYTRLSKAKKPIYSALLDQGIVSGLGNIYVNETLHAVGIHPLQPANTISKSQVQNLLSSAREILAKSLEMKGTTLIDNLYQDPEGKTGEFAKMLQVYGKKHNPDVKVIKIGGRSVFVHNSTPLSI